MKTFTTLFLIIFSAFAYAQNSQNKPKDPVGGIWAYGGNTTLLFNQSVFSNWASGGINKVSLALDVDYEINYKENGWSWDTKGKASYGLSYLEGDKFLKKTNDRLEVNSLLGKEFSDTWSYSTILNFKSQFSRLPCHLLLIILSSRDFKSRNSLSIGNILNKFPFDFNWIFFK